MLRTFQMTLVLRYFVFTRNISIFCSLPYLLNLENQNRFKPFTKDDGTRTPQTGRSKDKYIRGLKFASIKINSIRGKKLELLAFLGRLSSTSDCANPKYKNLQLHINFRINSGILSI